MTDDRTICLQHERIAELEEALADSEEANEQLRKDIVELSLDERTEARVKELERINTLLREEVDRLHAVEASRMKSVSEQVSGLSQPEIQNMMDAISAYIRADKAEAQVKELEKTITGLRCDGYLRISNEVLMNDALNVLAARVKELETAVEVERAECLEICRRVDREGGGMNCGEALVCGVLIEARGRS